MLDHVLGYGGFRYLDPELEQFTMDSRRTPQRISAAHLPDQCTNFEISFGTTSVTTFPSLVITKTLTVPANDSFRLNDVKREMPP